MPYPLFLLILGHPAEGEAAGPESFTSATSCRAPPRSRTGDVALLSEDLFGLNTESKYGGVGFGA